MTATTSAGLEVHGVTVQYRAHRQVVTAVDAVSLRVEPGRTLALLGPSGCGKSTLLRAIAGIEPLTTGTIAWDGHQMNQTPTHLRGFGMMFQDGQLFTTRDVAGNIAYGLRGTPWGDTRHTRRARIAEVLDLVDLSGYQKRSVTSLSGGQAQRVALARLLARAPKLMLFDEPLASLDRGLRERLAGDLSALLHNGERTAIYVTHDQDEARTVADDIAIMQGGRIVQTGPAEHVLTHPTTAQVADFLGTSPSDVEKRSPRLRRTSSAITSP